MSELSIYQVQDALGIFTERAQAVTGAGPLELSERQHDDPSYSELARSLNMPEESPVLQIPPTIVARQSLAALPRLRVTVGMDIRSSGSPRKVFFPGVVLESAIGQEAKIGFLKGASDAILSADDLTKHLNEPLSSFKDTLLERTFGLHTALAGQHGEGNIAAPLESAHGALIAVTDPRDIQNLHRNVHQYVGNGLAKSISAPKVGNGVGALDLLVNGRIRQDRSDTVAINSNNLDIFVARKHQTPRNYSSFAELSLPQLVIGSTLAAVISKRSIDYPQPDLAKGMEAVVTT